MREPGGEGRAWDSHSDALLTRGLCWGWGGALLGSYGMLVTGGSPETQTPKRHTVNRPLVDTRDLGRAPLSLASLNLEGLHAHLPLRSLCSRTQGVPTAPGTPSRAWGTPLHSMGPGAFHTLVRLNVTPICEVEPEIPTL